MSLMLQMEKRTRQRQKSKQAQVLYNPEGEYEYFQICVNIIEAKKLSWSNSQNTSYVIVILGKEKHRTTIKKHMEEPQYKEYFIFEWYATLAELQQGNLWLAVMEPRCCTLPKMLGETHIDLGTIWDQPNHQVFHKWAQLSLPRELEAGTVGFLKVDISIVCRDEIAPKVDIHTFYNTTNDRNNQNHVSEQQTANYLITVYGAFSLPLGSRFHKDRCYGKPPNTYVKVSFCGLSARTAMQYRTVNPTYHEQITIVEIFPYVCPLIRFEVCTSDFGFNKVLASTDLKLSHISHNGENGFVPIFGPCLLHMYGNNTQNTFCNTDNGPNYKGALLVSLKTIVPYTRQQIRTINVEPVLPIEAANLWTSEDFCIYCPVLEVSLLDRHIFGKVSGVAMSIGEIPVTSNRDPDFALLVNEIRTRILHHTGSLDVLKTNNSLGYLDFSSAFPVLQLGITLPDFRSRIFRNNLISNIIRDLEIILRKIDQTRTVADGYHNLDLLQELSQVLDDTATNIMKFLDYIQTLSFITGQENTDMTCHTELDNKQITLQKEEMEKIYKQVSKKMRCGSITNLRSSYRVSIDNFQATKKELKVLSAETRAIVHKLKSILFKNTEGWPDIIIWLLRGSTRAAYYKMSPGDIIHSNIPEQSGKYCGRIQTVYLKPIKCSKHLNTLLTSCHCITGKIELMMWMGRYSEKNLFVQCIPKGYKLKTKDYDMCLKSISAPAMMECRAFIYQAKLRVELDTTNQPSTYVRMSILNSVVESKVQQCTISPTWNQVLKINTLSLTSQSRNASSPPAMLIEVYEKDFSVTLCDSLLVFVLNSMAQFLGKCELIGRAEIKPVIDDRPDYQYAPKLQWHSLCKGTENTGKILMSAQIIQIPETLMKSTFYGSAEGIEGKEPVPHLNLISSSAMQQMVEKIPSNLIPKFSKYKMDVYWWGLRDVEITKKPCAVLEIEEVVIKSEIITDKKNNSNFPNGRISQVFEAPLNELYCPSLKIRLFDSNTFGRTLFLGTNVVKNPKKYVVNWMPKIIREGSLKSNSITSSDFFRVSDSLFVKRSSNVITVNKMSSKSMESIQKNNLPKKQQKKMSWRRLFCRKQNDEEEFVLLPIYNKDKPIQDDIGLTKTKFEYQDWWLKFYSSLKCAAEQGDMNLSEKIKIYDSELEVQPEFSKFMDWCKTLKLYNGNRTGLPDEDEKIQCGYLKAGIAIYEWPPPPKTIAVSNNGTELDRGFFDDYPNNDPNTFLVRVYIIRGLDLIPKEFVGKSDPYVVIKCGSKISGDRNQFIPNSVNPVFGKMHEFRCTLPDDYLLSVSLFVHSTLNVDEFIGSTEIDIENRVYTKHRARVGLASEYNSTGPAKWRDCMKPSAILEEVCLDNHMPSPIFPDNHTVIVNGVEYKDEDSSCRIYSSSSECKESLCLMILQKWHTLASFGYHLVPEHVETRKLWNPDKPGQTMGKIQMWVDIFPLDGGYYIPHPVNITPRKVEEYELRVIIWSVQNVGMKKLKLKKKGIDIYAKAWIGYVEQAQYTDIHYHSAQGEGCFNWRMIFNFSYLHAESMIVKKEKGPFIESEEHVPPIFVIQIIDNDATTYDDCLASVMLDLNSLPLGSKSGKYCAVDIQEMSKKINLFSVTTIRGWWPLKHVDRNSGLSTFAGLIDLELTLIPKDKALLMPVGIGREPPFPLPEPSRSGPRPKSENSLVNEKSLEVFIVLFVVAGIMFSVYYWQLPDILLTIAKSAA